MQHYFGAQAIAARLACDPVTLWRWRQTRGVPVILRRHRGHRVLYASEAMLTAWELAQARLQAPPRRADLNKRAGS